MIQNLGITKLLYTGLYVKSTDQWF